MSQLSEQLQNQRARAGRAQAELEVYKKESKEMEEYLEGESAKKEAEIRKMINDSIMKEKAYKAQKNQLTEFQNQNAKLKEQIARLQQQIKEVDPAAFSKMEEEASSLRKAVEQLKQQLSKERQKLTNLNESSKKNEAQCAKEQARLNEEVELAKSLAQQLKRANQALTQKLNDKSKVGLEKKAVKQAQLQRSSSKKQIKLGKQLDREKEKLQQRMKQLQQGKRKLQQLLYKSDKTIKDLRLKNQALIEENQALQSRISAMPTMSNCNSQSLISHFALKSVIEEQESSWGRINYSCLLLTKPHYVSPFLQVEQDKQMVRIYKSTRSGCFEKSMGLNRHKFDVLSYQQERVIDPIVNSITQSEHASHHSVILFGVKKSSKKYLMAKLLQKLKSFLIDKLQQGEEAYAEFTVRSQEEQKNETVKGEDNNIVDVLQKVIGKGKKSEKQKGKQYMKKGPSKPKVRYFSFKTNSFSLEIGTSSFTSLSFRDKMTPTNMLNNILYSKLPDILQSAISQKYLILTLNPIVDLYEDCRNTLSTTLCKAVAVQPKEEDQDRGWRASPVREQLNQLAKKKLEIFERESEQAFLKTRKLQQDCVYYKSRFDELQFRLKNLLNTHSGQNSYLKKSPVTLSYQKLLKYVHSVQSRTSATLNSTMLGSSMLKSAVNDREQDSSEAL